VRACDVGEGLNDEKQHLEELIEERADSGRHSEGDDVKCRGKGDDGV
jgi:hypothetical protein